ncbi:MAG: epoxide hydrolase [Alphaproteobacteria bacterium]|nr:epoxide hydrolase [Alphaproteobacteria bacterium]MCB9928731.1 epoxide hydrolase [Alphaproteobacteria bacterium]
MSDAIREFRIAIPDADLADLRRRLKATRWPEKEAVDDWSQGTPLAYLQEVCAHWADGFDWRAWEAKLNGWPQFVTAIDGLDIHFFHVRSPHAEARPLVITHGWPGSQIEFHKVIDPLVNPTAHGGAAKDAFHVVAPSLPGYGFSGKPTAPGWGIEKIADAWAALMARLGYDRYFAQGGDWGSAVTGCIGAQDPAHCAGIHLNMVSARPTSKDDLTRQEQSALAAYKHYQDWDSGYSKQQATRPQSVAYALADSPSGQCGWILEKFWAWTDNDGHPESALGRDEMLANISIYWLTNSAASSARLYWQSFGSLRPAPIAVPVGAAIYPKEIFRASRRWAEARFANIVHWSEQPKGGHFAAFEQPEAFVADLRACFGKMAL